MLLLPDRTHLTLRPIQTPFIPLLSCFIRFMFLFSPKIDILFSIHTAPIPSESNRLHPGGSLHQFPSAVTLHLTVSNVAVWLPWKPTRQVPSGAPCFAVTGPRAARSGTARSRRFVMACHHPAPTAWPPVCLNKAPWCPAVPWLRRRKVKCKKLSKLRCRQEPMVQESEDDSQWGESTDKTSQKIKTI